MRRPLYLLLATLIFAAQSSAQVVGKKPGVPPQVPKPGTNWELPGDWPLLHADLSKFEMADWHNLPDFQLEMPGHTFAYAKAPAMPTWYQGDPADSLFRAAHSMFGRQEYRPAAERYADLRTKHPTSRYWCDAAYYEAFARYRLGTPNDLRTANRVLESMDSKCTTAARRNDVPELQVRIDGALARLGDSDANERLKRAANQGTCDREEQSVKIQALSSLAQMDAQAATPVLRTVLNSRDACSAPIRRQALELIARRNDAEAVAILGQVARSDTDRETQYTAVRALARMNNDAAYAALEEYLRTSTDERLQIEAAGAMAQNDNPRAQAAIRALIERKDVAERIRSAAINSLAGRSWGTVDYWRGLYGRVESDDLRKAIINAVARIQTDEAHTWLLSIARSQNEPYEARTNALSKVRATAPINELYRILETADSRSMRMTIVSGLASRKEPEATDRLIDIAKNSTDVEVRTSAIRALSSGTRKDDPKVVKALADLLLRQM